MSLILDGTNGETFPSWTTATRPASPVVGQMGYNTTTGNFDAYTASGWVSVANSGNAPVSGPAFSAQGGGATSISNATNTKLTYGSTVNFDTNSNYSTVNSRFTPTVAGYYQINAGGQLATGSGGFFVMKIYKNNSQYEQGSLSAAIQYSISVVSSLIYMNGSTDYIEIFATQSTGSTQTANGLMFNGYLARTA